MRLDFCEHAQGFGIGRAFGFIDGAKAMAKLNRALVELTIDQILEIGVYFTNMVRVWYEGKPWTSLA